MQEGRGPEWRRVGSGHSQSKCAGSRWWGQSSLLVFTPPKSMAQIQVGYVLPSPMGKWVVETIADFHVRSEFIYAFLMVSFKLFYSTFFKICVYGG